jgi:hypothetical protein
MTVTIKGSRKTSSRRNKIGKYPASGLVLPGVGLLAAGYLGNKILSRKNDSVENKRLTQILQECNENFQKADRAYREWEGYSLALQEEIKKLKNDIQVLEKQLNYRENE